MDLQVTQGDRVMTPSGPGTVGYVRLFYGVVEAVSVVLDAKRHRPGYAGSIFPPERLSSLPAASTEGSHEA